MGGSGRQHPLLKGFDANERIKTQYANVDFPHGSYDDEQIRFIKGDLRLRVELPRPKTRYDRIMSFPITTKALTTREIDLEATAAAALEFPKKAAEYATKLAATGGLLALVERPPNPPGLQYSTTQHESLVRESIFDFFMSLDANYQSVPPAQCIRVTNFSPPPKISAGPFGFITTTGSVLDCFAENTIDKQQWEAYPTLLYGTPDVWKALNAYLRGNLISEWDDIFNNDIAPLIFDKIVSSIRITKISTDFTSETKYKRGEKLIGLNLNGTTSLKMNQLPLQLIMSSTSPSVWL
jgi:hypothetical protein